MVENACTESEFLCGIGELLKQLCTAQVKNFGRTLHSIQAGNREYYERFLITQYVSVNVPKLFRCRWRV